MRSAFRKRDDFGCMEKPPVIKSVDEYNALVTKIISDINWFDEFIWLCKHYYESEPCGGSLHIVLDDGNLEDSSIAWCAGYACAEHDEEGSDLANLMEMMTVKQRERVYESNLY